ncbi:hypothetical protein M23134_07543 [Microscilla marina ATCC 23134]|uniref:Uncharacterized protein n=1 Tax=Microscilla marina ATCC 23134 TaxID=313606 RepID=A1ZF34_MICM2|nr:hypothetical protein M23134_07543 [Microscilla marina ATCC 23134]
MFKTCWVKTARHHYKSKIRLFVGFKNYSGYFPWAISYYAIA